MAWYNDSWQYRVKVTVASSQVTADLTDFSVVVDLSTLPAGFHTNVKSDGGDIRVTKTDETTEVPRDVIDYDAGSDTGVMRFKAVGTLSSSADTDFYIYYGNASASEPAADATYGQYNAYDANWLYSWECNEASGDLVSRTSNAQALTATGSPTYRAAGKLGYAVTLSGTGQYFTATGLTIPNEPLSFIGWGKVDDTANNYTHLSTGDDGLSGQFYRTQFLSSVLSARKRLAGAIGDANTSTSYSTDTWTHSAAVFTSDTSRTQYINGTDAVTDTTSVGDISTHKGVALGVTANKTRQNPYAGEIGMAQIHSTARSADWIAVEYNQTNNNAGFLGIGTQEEVPVSFVPQVIWI